MGLKLKVGKEDKIVLDCGVVIDVLETHRTGEVTLSFEAPQDIKINTIFKDSSKQFKHLKKGGNR